MLKIKLIRFGKKNQPHYRIVVQEARTKRDGKYTAKLGHYAPTQEPKILEINLEEYKQWMAKGAQPTETVASLVKRFKTGNPFPPKKKKPSKKQLAKEKKAKEEPKEAVVEKPAEVTEEPKETVSEKPVVETKKPVAAKKESPAKTKKPVAAKKDTKKEAETK